MCSMLPCQCLAACFLHVCCICLLSDLSHSLSKAYLPGTNTTTTAAAATTDISTNRQNRIGIQQQCTKQQGGASNSTCRHGHFRTVRRNCYSVDAHIDECQEVLLRGVLRDHLGVPGLFCAMVMPVCAMLCLFCALCHALTLFGTEVSLQVQKRPPNSCTPMMAKMRKKSPTTMDTFAMDANDKVTERKTSIMPGLLVKVLQMDIQLDELGTSFMCAH